MIEFPDLTDSEIEEWFQTKVGLSMDGIYRDISIRDLFRALDELRRHRKARARLIELRDGCADEVSLDGPSFIAELHDIIGSTVALDLSVKP